jgi:hypothetical protein
LLKAGECCADLVDTGSHVGKQRMIPSSPTTPAMSIKRVSASQV